MANKTEPEVYTSIARLYDLLDLPFEYFRYRHIREQLWQNITGEVLDAGVGTGRNMEYYPVNARITGIDLSPAMLGRARKRQQRLNCDVRLLNMNVTALSFKAQSFDVVVSTFLFCVLDDALQLPALKELARVCRKDGEIHILEYAYSKRPLKRLIMRLWAPWVKWMYGARFDRNTEQYADAAGLELVSETCLHQDIIKLLVFRLRGK